MTVTERLRGGSTQNGLFGQAASLPCRFLSEQVIVSLHLFITFNLCMLHGDKQLNMNKNQVIMSC